MSIHFFGSGTELSLLRECAQACVNNGGEWYRSAQMAAVLGEHVGRPALLADAAYIGMARPELVLQLLDIAEGKSAAKAAPPQPGTEPGMAEAVKAIEASVHMPPEMARNYLEMLGHAATKFMRAKFGEEYTRGYLEAALAELDQPPMLTIRKPS